MVINIKYSYGSSDIEECDRIPFNCSLLTDMRGRHY